MLHLHTVPRKKTEYYNYLKSCFISRISYDFRTRPRTVKLCSLTLNEFDRRRRRLNHYNGTRKYFNIL